MSDKPSIENILGAICGSCIDEGEYDPVEDYIKDPFCRRVNEACGQAIEHIATLTRERDEARAALTRAESDARTLAAELRKTSSILFRLASAASEQQCTVNSLGWNTKDDVGRELPPAHHWAKGGARRHQFDAIEAVLKEQIEWAESNAACDALNRWSKP